MNIVIVIHSLSSLGCSMLHMQHALVILPGGVIFSLQFDFVGFEIRTASDMYDSVQVQLVHHLSAKHLL